MNKTGIYFMIAGVAVVIIGAMFFQNLHTLNAVQSTDSTVNLNGIRSFAWPRFIGIVLFVIGLITVITPKHEPGHRY
ncbi:hypothetical protein KXQ82_00920 [Mucilaginibacter sp. HMF5004]|uniref:hypothetical protein n=1 Tax=Mucilaginibacter rivuli TaxID=2857527 RepID=UPI001C5D4D60|nr:hypothetical protein [Mucilaginibacter rivuli]MBW4888250.1 hypothetical protein [Mucilaginibacter rivuli]